MGRKKQQKISNWNNGQTLLNKLSYVIIFFLCHKRFTCSHLPFSSSPLEVKRFSAYILIEGKKNNQVYINSPLETSGHFCLSFGKVHWNNWWQNSIFGRLKPDHLQHHKFAMKYCKKKVSIVICKQSSDVLCCKCEWGSTLEKALWDSWGESLDQNIKEAITFNLWQEKKT